MNNGNDVGHIQPELLIIENHCFPVGNFTASLVTIPSFQEDRDLTDRRREKKWEQKLFIHCSVRLWHLPFGRLLMRALSVFFRPYQFHQTILNCILALTGTSQMYYRRQCRWIQWKWSSPLKSIHTLFTGWYGGENLKRTICYKIQNRHYFPEASEQFH